MCSLLQANCLTEIHVGLYIVIHCQGYISYPMVPEVCINRQCTINGVFKG